MKRLYFLIALCILISKVTNAQFSRYIIVLKDKKGSPYTLSAPSAFLSAKSIERRTRQKINIDSTDIPVSPAYLDSIHSVSNVTILNKSNWLNQVCILTTDVNALAKIRSFSFVQTATPIAARIRSSLPVTPDKFKEFSTTIARTNNTSQDLANTLNYGNTFNQVHIHHGEYLHNLGFTGEGVTMAILDAGFFGYKTNPAFDSVRLQNRVLGEWDFVANEQSVNEDNSHGMYCFSIIAANRPGSMVGSGPKAKFYLFRTEDVTSEYPVEEQNWSVAAERADSLGADMISSSLGYSDFDDHSFDHSYLQRNGNTSIVTRAADLAAKKGMIVTSSAGNSGNNTDDTKFTECPADGDSVVAVGAVDINGNIAAFSSWGPNGAGKIKPNIVSVGQGTTIAGFDGNPLSGNGTSFSNPNIAGLIACLWQAFPEFTNMEIIDAVQRSAHKYNNPDNRFGYGIPDFKKAFAALIRKSFKGSVSRDNCFVTIAWTGKDDQNMRYEIEKKAITDTGYMRIRTVNGKSASFGVNNYSFLDTIKSATATSVEYRIKQRLPEDTLVVLLDSVINVTEVCSSENRFVVSPNPFNNNIQVLINATEFISRLSIALYNTKGQRLYYFEGAKGSGIFTQNISGSHLPAGVYIIAIRDDKKLIFSKKVVK